ncbi:MAG: bifunctional metallophosphatase/5'-nucleotidase, partial [Pseudomonadota bacterium]
GSGGFLQSANTQYINGFWYINEAPIDINRTYKLAINDYLTSGKEQGLSFFSPNNTDFAVIDKGEKYDIRHLVIDQLK